MYLIFLFSYPQVLTLEQFTSQAKTLDPPDTEFFASFLEVSKAWDRQSALPSSHAFNSFLSPPPTVLTTGIGLDLDASQPQDLPTDFSIQEDIDLWAPKTVTSKGGTGPLDLIRCFNSLQVYWDLKMRTPLYPTVFLKFSQHVAILAIFDLITKSGYTKGLSLFNVSHGRNGWVVIPFAKSGDGAQSFSLLGVFLREC